MGIHRSSIRRFFYASICLVFALGLLISCSAEPAPSQPLAAQPAALSSSLRATPTMATPTAEPSTPSEQNTIVSVITDTTSLAPIQPLQNAQIIDQPIGARKALTDGKQKYKTAVWGPSTDWIAVVPQDGPGLDIVNAATGELRAVVTDTYVLEPVWLAADALVVHRAAPGADELVRFTIGLDNETTVITTTDGPLRAVGANAGTITWSNPNQLMLTSQSSAQPTALPFRALVAAPAPQAADVSRVAISPLVSNLENIQTLVVEPQTDTVKAIPVSEVGEGLWLPRWSPDGTKLVLTSIGGRIVASAVDGSARYDLGPGDSPAWSADNNRIAYAGTSAGDEFTSRDIHIVDWQGSGPRLRLTDAGEEEFYTSPSWSPDGTRIAFLEIDSGQLFVGVVPQH